MVSGVQTKQSQQDEHDNRLKRRLMGTAVLIALSVIFLPLIFDGSGTESQFKAIEPLQMEPGFDTQSLEKVEFPALLNSPEIEFVEDKRINKLPGRRPASSVDLNNVRSAAQIMEPPVSSSTIAIPENKIVPKVSVNRKTSQATSRDINNTKQRIGKQSWLIQTASFEDKINALSLRSELKKSGFPVKVEVAELKGKSIFRVYVGPIIGKSEATRVRKDLERRFNIETLLALE